MRQNNKLSLANNKCEIVGQRREEIREALLASTLERRLESPQHKRETDKEIMGPFASTLAHAKLSPWLPINQDRRRNRQNTIHHQVYPPFHGSETKHHAPQKDSFNTIICFAHIELKLRHTLLAMTIMLRLVCPKSLGSRSFVNCKNILFILFIFCINSFQ